MGKFAHLWLLVAVCTISPARTAAGQSSIDVVGLDGKTVAVSLVGLERKSVTVEDRGLKTTFEGVALSDVLVKAGIPLSDKVRGKEALSRVIVASARDGYHVVYSIAEVDATFSNQVVLLADTRDGKPLLPDTGPLQIVVPNDRHASRWIRQVTKLTLRQLP